MASVDRVHAVNPVGLSAALPPVRVTPDQDKQHHKHQEKPEEQVDSLELHEETVDPEITPNLTLVHYDGLDLSA